MAKIEIKIHVKIKDVYRREKNIGRKDEWDKTFFVEEIIKNS